MANRTYLYAQKDDQFTGIGEFRSTVPFLAELFTHVDATMVPSIIFDADCSAFRGTLDTAGITDFLTKLRALFDAHRLKVLPKVWEEIETGFSQLTETLDRLTAGGYTQVLMEPGEVFYLSASSAEELADEAEWIESELADCDPDQWLQRTETELRSGTFRSERDAWAYLQDLGLLGFFAPVLYFDLR